MRTAEDGGGLGKILNERVRDHVNNDSAKGIGKKEDPIVGKPAKLKDKDQSSLASIIGTRQRVGEIGDRALGLTKLREDTKPMLCSTKVTFHKDAKDGDIATQLAKYKDQKQASGERAKVKKLRPEQTQQDAPITPTFFLKRDNS